MADDKTIEAVELAIFAALLNSENDGDRRAMPQDLVDRIRREAKDSAAAAILAYEAAKAEGEWCGRCGCSLKYPTGYHIVACSEQETHETSATEIRMKADGPEAGHTFEVAVRVRGSSNVIGEPKSDSNWWGQPDSIRLRAWDRPAALLMAARVPMGDWKEKARVQVESIQEHETKIRDLLSDLYACTRVWSAWSYNTMTQDDFVIAAEDPEIVQDFVDLLIPTTTTVSPEQIEAGAHAVCNAHPHDGGGSEVVWEDAVSDFQIALRAAGLPVAEGGE